MITCAVSFACAGKQLHAEADTTLLAMLTPNFRRSMQTGASQSTGDDWHRDADASALLGAVLEERKAAAQCCCGRKTWEIMLDIFAVCGQRPGIGCNHATPSSIYLPYLRILISVFSRSFIRHYLRPKLLPSEHRVCQQST